MEEFHGQTEATNPAQPERTIWIVGEAKHNLTRRDVEDFARQVQRARLQELGIPLLFSYGRFA